jgi:hypothetical protein
MGAASDGPPHLSTRAEIRPEVAVGTTAKRWPDFDALAAELTNHLAEVTDRVIHELVHADTSEAPRRPKLPKRSDEARLRSRAYAATVAADAWSSAARSSDRPMGRSRWLLAWARASRAGRSSTRTHALRHRHWRESQGLRRRLRARGSGRERGGGRGWRLGARRGRLNLPPVSTRFRLESNDSKASKWSSRTF